MKVRIYKYKTRGIYEWGRGFISNDISLKWHQFWEHIAQHGKIINTERNLCYWRIFQDDIGCDILIAIGGSIYLHPMNGDCVIRVINEVPTDYVYAEFCRIMNACAAFIGNGASIEMHTSRVKTIKE